MTTNFPTAPRAYGLNGPSASVTVEKSPHASHTEILTPPVLLAHSHLTRAFRHSGDFIRRKTFKQRYAAQMSLYFYWLKIPHARSFPENEVTDNLSDIAFDHCRF